MSDAAALRLGPTERVRGGASVMIVAPPASPEEEAACGVSEAEAAAVGLFQARLIEFGETKQEPVVSVRPVVREELVVGRSVEARVERVEETVRRTEVEVEELPARPPDDPPTD